MESMKRISLLLRQDQHDRLADQGLNVSGLVRDLIDDYLSECKITLAVTEETKYIYDQIVSNTGSTDEDLEPYLRNALKQLLSDRLKSMQKMEKELFK